MADILAVASYMYIFTCVCMYIHMYARVLYTQFETTKYKFTFPPATIAPHHYRAQP